MYTELFISFSISLFLAICFTSKENALDNLAAYDFCPIELTVAMLPCSWISLITDYIVFIANRNTKL